MKNIKLLAGTLIAAFILSGSIAYGLSVFVVPQGGTGSASFSPKSFIVSGATPTSPLTASSSPTFNYITATSTATSTFAGGISAAGLATSKGLTITGGSILDTSSATSTFSNGIVLTGGCIFQNGACLSASGTGTVTSITAGSGLSGGSITTSGTIALAISYNPFTAASFVATSTATSTISVGIEANIIGASRFFATSTTASSSLTNFSFTQAQGTGLTLSGGGSFSTLSLSNALTVANGGTGAVTLTGCLTGNGTGAVTGSGTCVISTRALTIAGTANQITSSAGSQDLSSDRTWTLSLPSVVNFPNTFFSGTGTSTLFASASTTIGNLVAGTFQATSTLKIPTGVGGFTSTSTGFIQLDTTNQELLVATSSDSSNPIVLNGKGSLKGLFSTSTLVYMGSFGTAGTTTLNPAAYDWPIVIYAGRCLVNSTGHGTTTVRIGDGTTYSPYILADDRPNGIKTLFSLKIAKGATIYLDFGSLVGTVSSNVTCDFPWNLAE